MTRRDDRFSFDALEDLDTMAEVLQPVALKDRSEPLTLDQETRWRLEDALERAKAREQAQGRPFSRREVNANLRPPLCEQVGGEQRCFIPLLLSDTGDQHAGGRISQLVEPAL